MVDSSQQQLTESEQLRHALMAEKHGQAKRLLQEKGIDCWFTFSREGSDVLLPFLTGNEDMAGLAGLMIFADGPSVAVIADYDEGQVEGVFDQVLPYSSDWKEGIVSTLQERRPSSIGINVSETDFGVDGLTHGLYLKLHALLKDLDMADRLMSAEPVSVSVRSRKTPAEVERIRRACAVTARIFDDVTAALKPGLSEEDVAEIIRERTMTYGTIPAWDPAMCPAVSSSRSRYGHVPPGLTVLEPGDGLRVDFGVFYEGYCSDMQRTWYFAKPGESAPPADFIHAFETVRDGIGMAKEAIRPGLRGFEVDQPVRQFISDQGFNFTHALGHQIGRLVHDGGMVLGPNNVRYGDRSGEVIEEGMVFTLEPCVGPIALEEDIVVTADGCEYLSPPQLEIIVI